MKIITIYFAMEDVKGEAMRIIKQAVFSDEKLKEYLAEAKLKTFELIDKGLYLHRYEVYVHPKRAGKPYLNKYKVSDITGFCHFGFEMTIQE